MSESPMVRAVQAVRATHPHIRAGAQAVYRGVPLAPAMREDRQHIADAALAGWRNAASDVAPDRFEIAVGESVGSVTRATLYLIWENDRL